MVNGWGTGGAGWEGEGTEWCGSSLHGYTLGRLRPTLKKQLLLVYHVKLFCCVARARVEKRSGALVSHWQTQTSRHRGRARQGTNTYQNNAAHSLLVDSRPNVHFFHCPCSHYRFDNPRPHHGPLSSLARRRRSPQRLHPRGERPVLRRCPLSTNPRRRSRRQWTRLHAQTRRRKRRI